MLFSSKVASALALTTSVSRCDVVSSLLLPADEGDIGPGFLKKRIEQLIEEQRVELLFKSRSVAGVAAEDKADAASGPDAADAGLLRGAAKEDGARGLKKCTAGTCEGSIACLGATGEQACGSCNSDVACAGSMGDTGPYSYGGLGSCLNSAGDIGPGSCLEDGSCVYSYADVDPGSCLGQGSCALAGVYPVPPFEPLGDKVTIGKNSCLELQSCAGIGGNVGSNSCQAPFACFGNQTDIPSNSCNECGECCEDPPGEEGYCTNDVLNGYCIS